MIGRFCKATPFGLRFDSTSTSTCGSSICCILTLVCNFFLFLFLWPIRIPNNVGGSEEVYVSPSCSTSS